MKYICRISGVILISVSIFLIHSCKKDKPTPPIIITAETSAITNSTALSGGNIISDGGAVITECGVCWSTIKGPTTAFGTQTTDKSGTGIFTSSITGLTAYTLYYVKAYATNSAGTAYGNELSFTSSPTIPDAPAVVIASAGYAKAVVAFSEPLSDGGSAIIGYTVTSNPDSITVYGTSSPITVTSLTNGTIYTFTVTATNEIGTGMPSSASNPLTAGTISDIDGNVYQTVKIDTQVWMAENLKTTKYNDGTSIAKITDNAAWAAATKGAYSDYNNIPANSTTYGKLFNWYVVDNNAATKVASNGGKNVCPTGWHVSSDAEWITLIRYVGPVEGGGLLKETGTSHWNTPNAGVTNETGFTALPGGSRQYNDGYNYGTYKGLGMNGFWWSSTEYSPASARYWSMSYLSTNIGRGGLNKKDGLSVRCIMD
jgi:uncharacterized protein (TIGR02145 family)